MPNVFLGRDPKTGKPYNIDLETHLLTIAGSGAGKGSCQIIPNLLRWPHSVVVVDPSGEAAKETAKIRAGWSGHEVAVLDPFNITGLPGGLKKTFNVLDHVETSEDLDVISDGIVTRSANESQPYFNESAVGIIKGVLAYLIEGEGVADDERHVGMLRETLTLATNGDEETLHDMRACQRFAGSARETALRLENEIASSGSHVLTTVDTQTKFLASERLQNWLSQPSTVDLDQLKRGNLSVYLVIPPKLLKPMGQFLRLFVCMTLDRMFEPLPDGSDKGTPCLFILDEFAALGQIETIRTSALQQGRKYGLHTWPFVVDIGQLSTLYGHDGAQTFLGSAQATCVFGVTDTETPKLVSEWEGRYDYGDIKAADQAIAKKLEQDHLNQTRRSARESQQYQEALQNIRIKPPPRPDLDYSTPYREREAIEQQWRQHPGNNKSIWDWLRVLGGPPDGYIPNRKLQAAQYDLHSRIGKPRRAPEAIRHLVRKGEGDKVARRMLVNTGERRLIELIPVPYFEDRVISYGGGQAGSPEEKRAERDAAILAVLIIGGFVGFAQLVSGNLVLAVLIFAGVFGGYKLAKFDPDPKETAARQERHIKAAGYVYAAVFLCALGLVALFDRDDPGDLIFGWSCIGVAGLLAISRQWVSFGWLKQHQSLGRPVPRWLLFFLAAWLLILFMNIL